MAHGGARWLDPPLSMSVQIPRSCGHGFDAVRLPGKPDSVELAHGLARRCYAISKRASGIAHYRQPACRFQQAMAAMDETGGHAPCAVIGLNGSELPCAASKQTEPPSTPGVVPDFLPGLNDGHSLCKRRKPRPFP